MADTIDASTTTALEAADEQSTKRKKNKDKSVKQRSSIEEATPNSPAVANLASRFASTTLSNTSNTLSQNQFPDGENEDEQSPHKRVRMEAGSTLLLNSTPNIPPEFLEAPVTCKKLQCFFDFLTRSKAAGKEYDTSTRNALIKKEAKYEIFYQMIIHYSVYGLDKPEDWDILSSEELCPLLMKVFKFGHKEKVVD